MTVQEPLTSKNAQMPNVPFRMSASPIKFRFPGLPMGAGSEVVFQEILDYDDAQCDSLMGEE
ncbi:MAG: hypothetical protein AAEF72_06870 [Gammaproteobacteria bacterium]